MSFLYPYTVTVSRPAAQTGVGFQPAYAADQKDTETVVVGPPGAPASIQERREGQRPVTGLPGDTSNPVWWIFIPLNAGVGRAAILEKDVVTDETGRRFTVLAAYWNSLGHRLSVELLQP